MIRSRDLGRSGGLIDRRALRPLRKVGAVFVIAAGWANSGVTTIASVAWVESIVAGQLSWVTWVVGGAIAVILSVGQVLTKDESGPWYMACLLPDVGLTALQHYIRWAYPVGSVLFGPWGGGLVAGLVSVAIGWFSARLPERLLFGKGGARHARSSVDE